MEIEASIKRKITSNLTYEKEGTRIKMERRIIPSIFIILVIARITTKYVSKPVTIRLVFTVDKYKEPIHSWAKGHN